ncbi:alpha/beta fold hydrolase [Flavobacterium fluviatile]|uniref:alpha/beta fold hydrolase n=1 Tax=Flavobacterium fluviatile TaxID=1862387 RepID=UPI0013D50FE1|nr:alpha/beta fold hydrolase [Flavobacterium fluviatile]
MLYSKIEGEGKPFVIMHGFLGKSDNWKTLAGQYVEAGFQVHILDLRNHGRSFHSDEWSYEAMSQDIFEYCQANNLDKIDLLGHSMGGKVAMLFAATHPEIVDKLIVADIGPKFYKQHHQDILAGLNAVDFSVKPGRADVEEIVSQYVSDLGTRQFLLKNLYWKEPGQLAFRFNLEVFNNNPDAIGKPLAEGLVFDKPTLFIRGGESRYILDSDVDAIRGYFPNLQLETIPNAGHWLHAENPKMFFDFTTAFLKS